MLNSYVWAFKVSLFGRLGDFWGKFSRKTVQFYGIIDYFQIISWLELQMNNVLLDVRLHQKSGSVMLPTASSFNKSSAFPRCKVA